MRIDRALNFVAGGDWLRSAIVADGAGDVQVLDAGQYSGTRRAVSRILTRGRGGVIDPVSKAGSAGVGAVPLHFLTRIPSTNR